MDGIGELSTRRLAQGMHLKTRSYGKDSNRHLVVYKMLSLLEIVKMLLSCGGQNVKYLLIPPEVSCESGDPNVEKDIKNETIPAPIHSPGQVTIKTSDEDDSKVNSGNVPSNKDSATGIKSDYPDEYYGGTINSNNATAQSSQMEHFVKVEEPYQCTATTSSSFTSAANSSTNPVNNFQTKTELPGANPRFKSKKGPVWEQFRFIEEQVLKNMTASNSNSTDPELAFVDFLITKQQEDTENLKISYENFVISYKKNNNKFQNNVKLNSYFQCRISLQTATGVYIPNIAQPDIDISQVTKDYSVLPLSKVTPDVQKRIRARITKQKRILHESRCIAYGIAFANKNPTVKNGLYWQLKKTCIKMQTLNMTSISSTLSEMFQKECFFLGKEKFKTPDQLWACSEGIFREMVSSILNPTPVKSLMPIYSPSYSLKCGIIELKELEETAPIMLVSPKPFPKRQTTLDVEIQQAISSKKKFEQTIDNKEIVKTSSSREADGKEQFTESIQLEAAATSSTVDTDLKFVDDLIKLKEKDTEELKNQYILFVEMYTERSSFKKPSGSRDFKDCRVKLQIATGVYLHNVHSPDIHPRDVPSYELIYKSSNMSLSKRFTKKLRQVSITLKEHIHKSMCIATGLSIIQNDPEGKRKVNHKLKMLNNTFFDSNERLKIVCIALEKELYDIGMKHLNLNPSEMWISNKTLLGQILSGIKRSSSGVKSLISIYSPQYNLPSEFQPSSCKESSQEQRALAMAMETVSTERIPTSTERVPTTYVSQKQGGVSESQQTKSTNVVPSTSGRGLPARGKKNKKKLAKALAEAQTSKFQGWLKNAKLPPKLLNNVSALSVNNNHKLGRSDLIRAPKPDALLFNSATSQPGVTDIGRRKQRGKKRAQEAKFNKSLKHSKETESDKSKKDIKFVKENELNDKHNDSGMEYSDEFDDSENNEVNNILMPNATSGSSISGTLLLNSQTNRAQDNENPKLQTRDLQLDNSILLPQSKALADHDSCKTLALKEPPQLSSRSDDLNVPNTNHLVFPQFSSISDDLNVSNTNHLVFPQFSSRSNDRNASSANHLLFSQFSSRQQNCSVPGVNHIEFISVLDFVDRLIAKREKDIKETKRVYNCLSLIYYENGRKFPDYASKTSYLNVRKKLVRETGVILPNIASSRSEQNEEFNIEEIEMKNLALQLISENNNTKFKFGLNLKEEEELYVKNRSRQGSYSERGREAFLLENFDLELLRLGQHITDTRSRRDLVTYP